MIALAAGATVAVALNVNDMATLNDSPIVCDEVASDPHQTDPSLAADGSKYDVSWTYTGANRDLTLTFGPDYGQGVSVVEIIVKIDKKYAICHTDDAKAGDVVKITNSGETAAISWIKLTTGTFATESTAPTTDDPTTTAPTLPGEEPSTRPPTGEPTTTAPTLPGEEPSTTAATLPGSEPTPGSDPSVIQSATITRSLASTGAEARTAGILTGALVLLGAATTLTARRRTANHRG